MVMKNRRLRLWALVLFVVTLALGVTRLIPVPAVSFTWKQARIGGGASYVPTFRIDEDRELVLVYIGSRFCGVSNDPALPGVVEELKDVLLQRSIDLDIGFSAVGIGVDWLATDGLRHLGKYGAFDEIVVGRKWDGFVTRQFVEEGLVRARATPQVLVYERRTRVGEDMDANAGENVVLIRKLGLGQILDWVDGGAPISNLR